MIQSADDPQAIAEALRLLRAGRLVAMPTDTVYGLCTHGLQPTAIKRIFRAKGRAERKAIPLLLSDTRQMEEVAQDIPRLAYELAEEFWPGGLTIVLFRKTIVPDILTSGGPTVALRVPDHSLPREIIKQLKAPLAATSANRSGGPEPLTAQDVNQQIGRVIHLILDGGPVRGGVPSTVVDLTSRPPRVLRQGAVPREKIARHIPDLE
ncbi:MAG: threonylcarbamoyl-AMP synthase [Chloroflexi bacterium]|nr:threonylcarbamoyl-AMP synthase [Chloroflexota bacterium]